MQLLMILYGDTINVSEIFTPQKERKTHAQTSESPNFLFITADAWIKKEQNKGYKG